jgi:ring-1,2-phenylacetyl-CoA epoxidase subunit PaaD
MTATKSTAKTATDALALAWKVASGVADSEIPVLTIADLGILRDVRIIDGIVEATITPTYDGCPVMNLIALNVEAALEEAGFLMPRIKTVLSPAWTTDWMTESARAKLRAYGIAPPAGKASRRMPFGEHEVACPHCGSANTERMSESATACKTHYHCKACAKAFEYFKCV